MNLVGMSLSNQKQYLINAIHKKCGFCFDEKVKFDVDSLLNKQTD